MCMRASTNNNNMGGRYGWSVRGNKQLSSSTKHLGRLRYPVEDLVLGCPRSRRMFSDGVAPGVKGWEYDGNSSRSNPPERDPLVEEGSAQSNVDYGGQLDGKPPDRLSDRQNQSSTTGTTAVPSKNEQDNMAPPTPTDSSAYLDPQPEAFTEINMLRSRKGTGPAADEYNATSELYRATLGTKLDWREALESVTKSEPNSKRKLRSLIYYKGIKSRNNKKAGDRSAVEIPSVRALAQALWQEEKSTQYLFRLYRNLPIPGVSYLSKRTRGELLRRFSKPSNRRWVDTRRYLALVEDMIASKLPLSLSLWTSAIHLAGRAAGRIWKRDLVRAIGLWQQMEHGAGVQPDGVVFAILFDISIKAGQYTVADSLVQEMVKRGHSFDRNGKVSMIYYHGLQQNIDGIRQAYNDLVNSGGLVDTVVLNCLMVSFIHAGDVGTAGHLYHRMMQAQTTAQKPASIGETTHHLPTLSSEFSIYHKRAQRLGHLLNSSASLKDSFPKHHAVLQEVLPMAPDTRTFYIFLKYHAHQSGDLHGFMSVLADMENTFAVPPRGLVYLLLFEGFAKHGRKRKGWTGTRLKEAWRAYLRALYESKHRLDERFLPQTRKIVWENPLASPAAAHASKPKHPSEDASSALYTALPLSSPKREGQSENLMPQTGDGEEVDEENDNIREIDNDPDSDVDMDELFGTPTQNQLELQEDELQEMERRIENGVFLGRRMIITILRAFGACCKPEDVMEVWMTIERIWQPKKRKALDVMIIKEELEKQMERIRRMY